MDGGGGLIGALIESAKTKNRQEAIAPLRDALLDFDYEAKLIEAIKTHLPTSMVKADAEFKVVRNEEQWRAHLQEVVPANVFLIRTSYAFEQDFDVAYALAGVSLLKFTAMPPDEKSRKKMTAKQRKAAEPEVLHQGSYISQHITHNPFDRPAKIKGMARYEQNAADWGRNDAEPVRIAFLKAMEEIADLIQRDGLGNLPPAPKKRNVDAFIALPHWQPDIFRGSRAEQSSGRSLIVIGQNHYWIDDRQIKRFH